MKGPDPTTDLFGLRENFKILSKQGSGLKIIMFNSIHRM
ncbi:conserved hypothetical protein [Candidatus Nitrosotenuis uzonensis]|uniref:Uncharacterized protein n=1 Tax=Candidatus Nitrosotenuis uzonensis TaxID=1407055 RepID=A0A812F8Y5_9ARCH|nr:conserved hypothetical protein [Candidatus Nitrosotenuis uzonensis]